jgi:hypothetical protein
LLNMTKQIQFQHNVIVARPVNEVFEYLRDFDNAGQWRVGLIQSAATPTGPAKPGPLVHEVSRLVNRYVATDIVVDDVTASSRRFSHLSGVVPMHGSFRCDQHPDGTNVTHAHLAAARFVDDVRGAPATARRPRHGPIPGNPEAPAGFIAARGKP